MQGQLYIVATPIGNLQDITFRAVDVLKSVDTIACEDTRHSARLLQHYAISTPLLALHEHNEDAKIHTIIADIQAGRRYALISDAGTPLISDPGYRLVHAAQQAGVTIVPVPGACAAITALSVAGLPSDRFQFIGFLPAKQHARLQKLTALKQETATLIAYEAPHRIVDTLQDIHDVLGATREVTLCRELTKTFETVIKLPVHALIDYVTHDPHQQKGEMVLVIQGALHTAHHHTAEINMDRLLDCFAPHLPAKTLAKIAAELYDVRKSEVYDRLIAKKT